MKYLVLALSSMGPATLRAEGRALLVTVDRYPFLSAEQRLNAAPTDLATMQAFCSAYRLKDVRALTQSQATREAIVSALDSLAASAKAGDDVLFYFGGRGGRALGADGSLTATLVPFDAKADTGSADLRLERVAQWANAVKAAGANPIIIVDACWNAVKTRSEARPYNTIARFVDRKAEGDLDRIYSGPGLFAAPCEPGGQAFEWKQSTSSYVGAFTDLLTSSAAMAAVRNERPSLADLVGNVGREASALTSQGYMPGFRPQISGDVPSRPLFGGDFQLPASGPMAELLRREREAAATFRIAVDIEPSIGDPIKANALYRQVNRELSAFARQSLDGVKVVGRDDFRPDRVIVVGGEETSLTLKVLDDVQKAITQDTPIHRGESVEAILKGGLADILQRDAYVSRLYRLAATNSPTLDTPWQMDFATKYRIGDPFSAKVTAEGSATAYVFDRADSNGIVRLMFPYSVQTETAVTPEAPLVLPLGEPWRFRKGSPLGISQFSVVLVDASSDPLPKGDPVAFAKGLTARLKSILDGIQAGRVRWSVKNVVYEVTS